MFIRRFVHLVASGFLVCYASVGQAAVVTYDWSGNIVAGAAVGGSNTISGTFSYDNASGGSGSAIDTPTLITFTFGSLSGTVTGNRVGIFNNSGGGVGDQFDFRGTPVAYSGNRVRGAAPSQFFLRFNDITQTVFSDTALPTTLNPANFTFPDPSQSRIDGWGVSFITTGFSSATVPEPGSLALVGLALAGLGFSRRKKQVTG